MNYETLVKTFADQPVIESSSVLTMAGNGKAAMVQLARWVSAGRLIRLRRGYYLLPPQYRKREPDLHYLANILVSPSYVSLEYALGFYGMIPETASVLTSVTTGRPQVLTTPLGRFDYRHVSRRLFWGYETLEPLSIAPVQIALPEKALLDLIYFKAGKVDEKFLESLRLQNLETIDMKRLSMFAGKFGGLKMNAALISIRKFAESVKGENVT